jgi:hypothetical protein
MNTPTQSIFLIPTILVVVALNVGCAKGPERVADDFGNSVRAMRSAQTNDPSTILNPDTTPVESTDGVRMESALKSYREGTSSSTGTSRPLQISIGGDD